MPKKYICSSCGESWWVGNHQKENQPCPHCGTRAYSPIKTIKTTERATAMVEKEIDAGYFGKLGFLIFMASVISLPFIAFYISSLWFLPSAGLVVSVYCYAIASCEPPPWGYSINKKE